MQKLTLGGFVALTLASAASSQWTLTQPGLPPLAREYPQMAYDSWRSEAVVFGGQNSWNPLNDTWLYNGSSWTQANPARSPTPRADATMAFDANRGVTVLFGGHIRLGGPKSDTWEWNGTNWSQKFPATTPGRRGRHGMAYDSARARVVMYGGFVAWNASLDDTWEYDGNNWTQVTTATTPGGRKAAAMCYHAGIGKTVLFGGLDARNSMPATDTWLYDGTNWTQLNHAIAPQSRHDAEMVYDPIRKVCILYGGRGVISGSTPVALDDTWEFDGTQWEQVASGQPNGRSEFSMAMDTARSRIVVFGGTTDNIGNVETDETWEFGSDASYQVFGSGCQGSNGVPTVSAGSLPILGLSWVLNVSNLDNASPAFMALGVSNTNWAGLPLPLPISSIGATGCEILCDHTIPPFPLVVAGGNATVSLTLPGNGSLLGLTIYNQAISFDRAANPLGLVTSNAGGATFGTN